MAICFRCPSGHVLSVEDRYGGSHGSLRSVWPDPGCTAGGERGAQAAAGFATTDSAFAAGCGAAAGRAVVGQPSTADAFQCEGPAGRRGGQSVPAAAGGPHPTAERDPGGPLDAAAGAAGCGPQPRRDGSALAPPFHNLPAGRSAQSERRISLAKQLDRVAGGAAGKAGAYAPGRLHARARAVPSGLPAGRHPGRGRGLQSAARCFAGAPARVLRAGLGPRRAAGRRLTSPVHRLDAATRPIGPPPGSSCWSRQRWPPVTPW